MPMMHPNNFAIAYLQPNDDKSTFHIRCQYKVLERVYDKQAYRAEVFEYLSQIRNPGEC